ncbi:ribonuclease P protein component [Nocardioides sp. CFH 31398]|uniref:ribonuclease P protein component n=1 Tax=Nocardioides sp. CFH 31398 TaxID=2919579 RepID=UPI001F059200|nr:ribonuclease P protein component [Nocardioides sp. CFH 31398]MCH1865695.1 ribonuclease P protein component [Nocardioides sp. CFH 31398]
MLPAANRLTSSAGFDAAVRGGRRCGSRTVVLHLGPGDPSGASSVRVGMVVSRAVGGAVVRNRVRRRLRHLVREHVDGLGSSAPGSRLVVRALPASASASYGELGRDLARCLDRLVVPTQPARS